MNPGALLEGMLHGNAAVQRRAMSKAITLLESTRLDHRAQADELLTQLLPHTGKSFRLGISGVPGVGKSTFIEALGLYLISQGHRVAVLTIDPSSTVSGGSILGDKTRMEHLSVHEKAYIRPSPSSGTLGGVAEKTREAMLVCEAAGYDVVIVETVGVGQSEVAVQGMVDTYLILMLARSGDQLQGIKKGILELAHVIAVNKADGDNAGEARVTARELSIAMKLVSSADSDRRVPVLTCSALHKMGLAEVWQAVLEHRAHLEKKYGLETYRASQQVSWMWSQTEAALMDALHGTRRMRALSQDLEHKVGTGHLSALDASSLLLHEFAAQMPDLDWAKPGN